MDDGDKLKVLRSLMGYVVRIRPDVILAMLVGIFSSGVELLSLASLIPLSILASHQQIQDTSWWQRIPAMLGFAPTTKFFATAFLSLLILRALSQMASALITANINRNLISHFSARALEAYTRHLSFAEVQAQSIGHFMAIAGDEANRAANIVSSLAKLVPLFVLFLLYGVLLVYQFWQIGLGLAFLSLVAGLCLLGIFRRSHTLGERQQRESRALNTHFIETMSGLRTVRSLNGEQFVVGRYDEMMRNYARTAVAIDTLNQVASMLPTLLLVTVLLAVCLFTSNQYLSAALAGIMVGALMVLRLLPLAAQTMDITQRLTADLKVAETIAELLHAVKRARIAETSGLPAITEPIRKIEFDHVSFRYDPELPPVLDGFSVTFTAGRSYAIAGASGAGKSTIVDLLLKFYRPQSGTMRVNGKDIENISGESLRKRIVLAEQAVRIFYDTIEHNVQFGRQATSQDVAQALDIVGLGDFLASLPDGQRTLLNYQGSNVSGGQRQRIGLARALLRSGDVLILDESTSALDHATREIILSRLLADYRDKIILFIAHDPSILELVDHVIHLGPPAAAMPAAAAG